MRDCAHCQSLWTTYERATSEHVVSENKLKLATLKRDEIAVSHLLKTFQAAMERRNECQAALRNHEANEHGVTSSLLVEIPVAQSTHSEQRAFEGDEITGTKT